MAFEDDSHSALQPGRVARVLVQQKQAEAATPESLLATLETAQGRKVFVAHARSVLMACTAALRNEQAFDERYLALEAFAEKSGLADPNILKLASPSSAPRVVVSAPVLEPCTSAKRSASDPEATRPAPEETALACCWPSEMGHLARPSPATRPTTHFQAARRKVGEAQAHHSRTRTISASSTIARTAPHRHAKAKPRRKLACGGKRERGAHPNGGRCLQAAQWPPLSSCPLDGGSSRRAICRRSGLRDDAWGGRRADEGAYKAVKATKALGETQDMGIFYTGQVTKALEWPKK